MSKSSFAYQLKNELARVKPENRCCTFAEFSALLRAGGTLQISSGHLSCYLTTNNAAVARHAFRLAKNLYTGPVEIMVRRQSKEHKVNRYRVRLLIPEEKKQILQTLGILRHRQVVEGIKTSLIRRRCCQRSYLRGVFLGCGSVNNPETGYHLEMVLPTRVYAVKLQEMLIQLKLTPGLMERKGKQVLYLKEADQIAAFFRLVSAHNGLLFWEDIRVKKEMRNQVNRLVNCDTANVAKAVRTGLQQVQTIQEVVGKMGWEYLPENIQKVAQLRLEHPEASLKEIGELLHPPLGKSGVNHRFRELESIAQQLRESN